MVLNYGQQKPDDFSYPDSFWWCYVFFFFIIFCGCTSYYFSKIRRNNMCIILKWNGYTMCLCVYLHLCVCADAFFLTNAPQRNAWARHRSSKDWNKLQVQRKLSGYLSTEWSEGNEWRKKNRTKLKRKKKTCLVHPGEWICMDLIHQMAMVSVIHWKSAMVMFEPHSIVCSN